MNLIELIARGYRYLNVEIADPRTKDWFLIGSPWPGIIIIGLYLHFVYKSGPSWMEKREPFNCNRIMQIYNVIQIVLNAFLFYKAMQLAWWRDYKYVCEPVDFSNTPRAIEIAATVWLFFIVKLLDLLDTIFFIFRKKNKQVTFLHVYHHAGMVLGGWGATKYLPGGHITFLGLVNSFVHVVMYSYYLLTSLNFDRPWWKKHITQLQLLQFFLIFLQFFQLILAKECDFPRWPAAVLLPQNVFMIFLFGDFYYNTYIKKTSDKKVAKNGKTTELSNGNAKMQ